MVVEVERVAQEAVVDHPLSPGGLGLLSPVCGRLSFQLPMRKLARLRAGARSRHGIARGFLGQLTDLPIVSA